MNKTGAEGALGIGSRVRAARERVGWNRQALADHSGLSWSAIAQVETGRRTNPRPDTLSALSKALGVTIDFLIHGTAPTPIMLEHQLLLYATEDEFLEVAGPFVADGVKCSDSVRAVTSEVNIAALRKWLGSDAGQVEFIDAGSSYETPAATLDSLQAFLTDKLDRGAGWVRILGEPVRRGRSNSEVRLWARYESLVNVLFEAFPLSILCPYDQRSVDPAIIEQARKTHPRTSKAGASSTNPDYTDPGKIILEA